MGLKVALRASITSGQHKKGFPTCDGMLGDCLGPVGSAFFITNVSRRSFAGTSSQRTAFDFGGPLQPLRRLLLYLRLGSSSKRQGHQTLECWSIPCLATTGIPAHPIPGDQSSEQEGSSFWGSGPAPSSQGGAAWPRGRGGDPGYLLTTLGFGSHPSSKEWLEPAPRLAAEMQSSGVLRRLLPKHCTWVSLDAVGST